jgi:hypothetical protein
MWPKWLRAVIGAWVVLDSRDRQGVSYFWTAMCVFLGPLLLPFYLALRPLIPGECRSKSFLWNLFWGYEQLMAVLLGFAGLAAGIENFLESENLELPVARRAEIKAGTIMGMVVSLALFFFSRVVVSALRQHGEK